jgi:hypothetical protein
MVLHLAAWLAGTGLEFPALSWLQRVDAQWVDLVLAPHLHGLNQGKSGNWMHDAHDHDRENVE